MLITIKEFLGVVAIMLMGMVGTYMIGLESNKDEREFERLDAKAAGEVKFLNGRKSMQDEIEDRAEQFYYKDNISPQELEIIIFGESQE